MLSLKKHRRILVLTGAVILVIVVGWGDYVTGPIAFTVFYMLTVALAAWLGSFWIGLFISAAAAATWEAVQIISHVSYITPFARYWNVGEHLAIFVVTALLVSAVRVLCEVKRVD